MFNKKYKSIKEEITKPYSSLILLVSLIIFLTSSILTIYNSMLIIKEYYPERSKLIINEIKSFLSEPIEVANYNDKLNSIGILQTIDDNKIQKVLLEQFKISKNLSLIGFGYENGDYFDMQEYNEKEFYFSNRDKKSGITTALVINKLTEESKFHNSYEYDHRLRPWYTKNKKANDSTWIPIYASISPETLMLTYTKPFADDFNNFQGVSVSSISLDKLSDRLKSLKDLGEIDILILKNNGDLVASTLHEQLYTKLDNNIARINLNNKKVTYIFEESIVTGAPKTIKHEDNFYFLHTKNLFDDIDLEWKLVILYPAETTIIRIIIRILITLLIAIIINIIAMKIGHQISLKISKPINIIKDTANLIVNGDFSVKLNIKENNEIGELGKSFNTMKNTINCFINNLEELVEQRTMELELAQKRLSLHINNTPLAVIEWDNNFLIKAWNSGAENIFGYTGSEVINKESASLILPKDEATNKKIKDVMDSLITNTGGSRSINLNITKNKELIYCDWYNTTLVDSSGTIYGVASLALNITDQIKYIKDKEEQNKLLKEIAEKDGLTTLYNRRSFDNYIASEWNRALRNSSKLSFIIIDIDHFKKYNDYYGHQKGDTALQQVAKVIKSSIKRPGDKAFRYGGEEFACILPETDEEGVLHTSKMILSEVEGLEIEHSDSSFGNVTVSIGISTIIPNKKMSYELLVKLADKRLYYIKNNGRNGICNS